MSLYRGLFFATLTGTIRRPCVLGADCAADGGAGQYGQRLAAGYRSRCWCLAWWWQLDCIIYFDKLLLGKIRGTRRSDTVSSSAESLRFWRQVWPLGWRGAWDPRHRRFTGLRSGHCASHLSGLDLGLRWAKSNIARVLHTYAGGLVGGLLGGLGLRACSRHTCRPALP